MIAVPQVRAVTLKGYIEVARFVGLDPSQCWRRRASARPGLKTLRRGCPRRRSPSSSKNSASLSGCDSFGLLMQECRTYESLGPSALLFERLPDIRTVLAQIPTIAAI